MGQVQEAGGKTQATAAFDKRPRDKMAADPQARL